MRDVPQFCYSACKFGRAVGSHDYIVVIVWDAG